MESIGRWETQFRIWIGKYGHFLLINLFFGVLVYFTMMSESLVNSNDGLLYTSHYNAGAVEISSGRGMLYYLDKIRSGVISVPLNSCLTIAVISVTGTFILELLSVDKRWMGFVMTMVLIANPITCATLSYCYTSVNYGAAFLFGVLAVYCVQRCRSAAGILLGGLFLAISMGCYQAYFSVTCLLILMVCIQKLLQSDDVHKIARFLMRSALAIAAGGCLYYIFTKLMLFKFNIEISDYKGASGVSMKTIALNLTKSIPQCYTNYFDFFKTKMGLTGSRRFYILLLGICSIAVFCVIYHICALWKKNWRYALLFGMAVCLGPIASSAITIIVPGSNSALMQMGFLLSVILLIVLVPGQGKISFLVRRAYFGLMLFLLWSSILSVTNEQLALKEGKRASVALAEIVLNELIADDYLEGDYAIAMIGKSPANDLFAKREAWQNGNGMTRFGDGWHNQLEFWRELYIEYCGVRLNFCTYEQYRTLSNAEEVENMPNFPEKGSIVQIDGVTVVKISGDY